MTLEDCPKEYSSDPTKRRLQERQRQALERISIIQSSDPVLVDSGPVPEMGEGSWRENAHQELEAERRLNQMIYQSAKEAIRLVDGGEFGICQTCKGSVEEARLKSSFTAPWCSGCAAKRPVDLGLQMAA